MNVKKNDHPVENHETTENKTHHNHHFIHFRRNLGLPDLHTPHHEAAGPVKNRIK